MTKVKTNEYSSFLTGVSYYPRVPPRRLVSSSGRKIIYRPGTMVFIAIPYLGLESIASARFRRNQSSGTPLPQLETPLPQSETGQTQDKTTAKSMAERLTGYHVVDNLTTTCNSSLSLLEYRYSSKPDITASDMWRNSAGETRSKLPVVHQMWFMVFDDSSFIISSSLFACLLACSDAALLQRRLPLSDPEMISSPRAYRYTQPTSRASGHTTGPST